MQSFYILMVEVNKFIFFFASQYFLNEIEHMIFLFLLSFSINLLAFYYKCHTLIHYATHYLFCDSE